MQDERYRTVFALWTAAREVGALVQPVPAVLAAYRPAQRHFVLDARHVGVDDLPEPNLVTAVVRLEQTRTPWDLVEVARRLRRWLRRPEDDGLRRVLGSWVREVAESFAPPGEALGAELTLEEVGRAAGRLNAAAPRFGYPGPDGGPPAESDPARCSPIRRRKSAAAVHASAASISASPGTPATSSRSSAATQISGNPLSM